MTNFADDYSIFIITSRVSLFWFSDKDFNLQRRKKSIVSVLLTFFRPHRNKQISFKFCLQATQIKKAATDVFFPSKQKTYVLFLVDRCGWVILLFGFFLFVSFFHITFSVAVEVGSRVTTVYFRSAISPSVSGTYLAGTVRVDGAMEAIVFCFTQLGCHSNIY